MRTTLLVLGLAVSVLLQGCAVPSESPAPALPQARVEGAERTFRDMRSAGVVIEVSLSHDYTYIMVGRGFYLLTYAQKAAMAASMSDFSRARGGSTDVAFLDAYTKKKVATFVYGQFELK
jgi:hypothetical protein